jgi:hypothetical protein
MKGTAMKKNDVFPSKYLKAIDLKGKACVATIESAAYETLRGLDGKEVKKIVLYFKNAEKALPLNETNFDAICDATGCPDTDDWSGERIELFPTKTAMQGKQVDCIRIRRPRSSGPAPAAASSPPSPSADEPPADEMDDEIPF